MEDNDNIIPDESWAELEALVGDAPGGVEKSPEIVEQETVQKERKTALTEEYVGKFDKLQKSEEKEEKKGEDSAVKKLLGKGSTIQNIMEIGETVSGVFGVIASTPIFLAEDIYNTGVDLVNFIDVKFGDGEDLIENMDLSQYMPEETQGYAMLREASKFALGYSKILKGVQLAVKGPIKSTMAAGYLADVITAQPEIEALVTGFIKSVPGIGPIAYDFIHDPTDLAFTKRLKTGLVGMLEAGIAEGVFKAISHFAKAKAAKKVLDAVDEVEAPKKGGKIAPKTEVKSIPKLDADAPKRMEAVKVLVEKGAGGTESIRMVNKAGEAVNFNMETLSSSDGVKKMIDNIMSSNPERYGRDVLPDDALKKLAKAVNMEPKELMEWSAEQGLKQGQILAAVDMGQQVLDTNLSNFSKYAKGEITKEAMVLSHATTEKIVTQIQNMKSLSGSLLHEANVAVKKGQVINADYMKDLMGTHGGDIDEISKIIAASEPGAFRNFARAVQTKAIRPITDSLVAMRFASMLSNPFTHVRNVTTNSINMVNRLGETLFEATINSITSGKNFKEAATFADVGNEALGLSHGFLDAIVISNTRLRNVFRKSGKKIDVPFKGVDPSRTKLPNRILQSEVEPSESALGRALQFIDYQIVRGEKVGSALQFEDNFSKHMIANMTQRRMAYKAEREYIKQFSNGKMSKAEVKQGAFETRQRLMENPDNKMVAQMEKDAELYTFTNRPPEGIFRQMEEFSTKNAIGRLVAPFAKVNVNQLRFTIERIPGLNLLLDNSRAALLGTDIVARNRELAKMSFTSSTMFALGTYLHSNDMLVGAGPKEPGQFRIFEQAGMKIRTLKIGDVSIPLGTSPMANVLTIFNDIAEIREASDGDDKVANDAGMAYLAIVNSALNPEFLSNNVGKLFEALSRSDVKGAKAVLNMGADIAGSFAPYSGAFRFYTREFTAPGDIKREIFNPNDIFATLINKVKSVYMPNELAVKRNILGKPMFYKMGMGPSITSPFGVSNELNNPVIQELARLAGASNVINFKTKLSDTAGLADPFLNVSMPSKVVSSSFGPVGKQGTELNMVEYSKLVEYSAGIHPDIPERHTLENVFKKIFKDPRYKKAPFAVQSAIATKVLSIYKTIGKKLYLKEPVSVERMLLGIEATKELLK